MAIEKASERHKDDAELLAGIDEYKWNFIGDSKPVFTTGRGLSEDVVRQISAKKEEPQWMLDFRLKALRHFEQRPMPTWGGDLSPLNLDEIYSYTKPSQAEGKTWDEVPAD